MDSLKKSFVWVCNEIIARLDEAETVASKDLGDLVRLVDEIQELSKGLELQSSPISWDETIHDHPSDPNAVTIAFSVMVVDPTNDKGHAHLLYCRDETRETGEFIRRHFNASPHDLTRLRETIRTTMRRWIRYTERPDFGKTPAGQPVPVSESTAQSVPARPAPVIPSDFVGGDLKFYADRVELCGVDICSGSRSRSRRVVLELLGQKRPDGSFCAYSGEDLEAKAKEKGVDGSASRWIKDLRSDIQRLLSQANINSGTRDVILSGGPGYRFAKCVSVQFLVPRPITDITDMEAGSDVRDGDVRNVRDEEAEKRRAWILHQLAAGVQLKTPHVAKQFSRSNKTAQRDFDALREEGKIEFVGDPRTGYYRLTTR